MPKAPTSNKAMFVDVCQQWDTTGGGTHQDSVPVVIFEIHKYYQAIVVPMESFLPRLTN